MLAAVCVSELSKNYCFCHTTTTHVQYTRTESNRHPSTRFDTEHLKYSGTPISWTLDFSKKPISRTKSCFPWICFHCNFTPDISKFPISRTNFRFPWMFEKSKFHLYIIVNNFGTFYLFLINICLYVLIMKIKEVTCVNICRFLLL